MKKNPIGTVFKKENIFLATVNRPLEKEEFEAMLKEAKYDPNLPESDVLLGVLNDIFCMQEYDIFYKDEKGFRISYSYFRPITLPKLFSWNI